MNMNKFRRAEYLIGSDFYMHLDLCMHDLKYTNPHFHLHYLIF